MAKVAGPYGLQRMPNRSVTLLLSSAIGCERGDVVQVHHEGGCEGDLWSDLIFQRHPERYEMTGAVAIDLRRAVALIQMGMKKTETGEGGEIESIVETKVILGDGSQADCIKSPTGVKRAIPPNEPFGPI